MCGSQGGEEAGRDGEDREGGEVDGPPDAAVFAAGHAGEADDVCGPVPVPVVARSAATS